MRSSVYVAFALSALAFAAPTIPTVEDVAERSSVDEYFNLIAKRVAKEKREKEGARQSKYFDLSKVEQPAAPSPLPAPGAGLTLKHIAIGRGTQNYTCGTNTTAAPTAIGAVADLFNVTGVTASYPEVLAIIPPSALQFNYTAEVNTTTATVLAPMNFELTGHHYFTDLTTPYFFLNAGSVQIGTIGSAKNASTPAPPNSVQGSVPWLKLVEKNQVTGDLQEVYRLNTAGGAAPATCAGMLSQSFEVQYAAEYWFYGK